MNEGLKKAGRSPFIFCNLDYFGGITFPSPLTLQCHIIYGPVY